MRHWVRIRTLLPNTVEYLQHLILLPPGEYWGTTLRTLAIGRQTFWNSIKFYFVFNRTCGYLASVSEMLFGDVRFECQSSFNNYLLHGLMSQSFLLFHLRKGTSACSGLPCLAIWRYLPCACRRTPTLLTWVLMDWILHTMCDGGIGGGMFWNELWNGLASDD